MKRLRHLSGELTNVARQLVWIHVQARLDSATVGDQARALAISGLRRESELADSELRKHWGDGFLGLAAKHAREWRARAAWTVDWIRHASQTKDPVDYWRFGTLAVGVADVRSLHLLAQLQDSWGVRRFGPSIPQALKRASIRRS